MTDCQNQRDGQPQLMHGTTIAVGDQAAMIIGPSGSGKSSTALQLLALGAELVADDRSELFVTRDAVWVRKPAGLPEMIEARGVGLLRVPTRSATRLRLVVDMGQPSQSRCPTPSSLAILGHSIPKIDKVEASHFPAAILLYLTQQPETN